MENVFAHLTGKEFKQVDLVPTEIYRQEDALAEEEAPVEPQLQCPKVAENAFDRVWKDKKGRLIMAKFVSLDGDDPTITRGDSNLLKLSSLSSESRPGPCLGPYRVRPEAVRRGSGGIVGRRSVLGKSMAMDNQQEANERRLRRLEIRWKEIGKSFVATFSQSSMARKFPL